MPTTFYHSVVKPHLNAIIFGITISEKVANLAVVWMLKRSQGRKKCQNRFIAAQSAENGRFMSTSSKLACK